MWLKPNADVGDILSIWQYALRVDGYQYATENLGLAWSNRTATTSLSGKMLPETVASPAKMLPSRI